MNERIKKLAEQAGLKQGEWSGHPPVWMETLDSPGGLEKFANLIVQECAEFARQHNLEHAERSHMIHRAIKEHFGVE